MHFCRESIGELNPWLLVCFLDWIQTQKDIANSHMSGLAVIY